LINLKLSFTYESQKQALNSESFTGPGAGFNEVDAFERAINQIKGFQIGVPSS
jgi:hypothetical protein